MAAMVALESIPPDLRAVARVLANRTCSRCAGRHAHSVAQHGLAVSNRAHVLARGGGSSAARTEKVALQALLVGAPEEAGALATCGEIAVEVLCAEAEGPDPRDGVFGMMPPAVEDAFAYRLARLMRVTGAFN